MTTTLSFPMAAPPPDDGPYVPRRGKAAANRGRMPIRVKVAIATVVVLLAILHGIGVMLMMRAADRPAGETALLLRSD